MRAYRTWATFLGAACCSAMPLGAQAPHEASKPQRNYGGWQAAPRITTSTAEVRQANFQAPGGNAYPSGSLPALPPGLGGASLPAEMGMSGTSSRGPALPSTSSPSEGVFPAGGANAAYDQFSNPGGQLPPTDVRQASGSGLRDVTQSSAPVYPPQTYSPSGAGAPVYPPPNSGGMPASHLRSSNPSGVAQQRQLHNGAEYNVPVVSQDPRFISPPPAPRVGNYATSPYQPSQFRLASYQVNQQVPAQTVQARMGQPGQPAVVANTSLQPQYQPVVGVHSTNYQQCGPGIPVAGVPQVVPGAVAPPTLPPNLTPQLYTPDNAGFKPLVSLGQENYNVLLGRGIIGQPTVYVPGQPFRNFFRYLAP